MPKQLYFLDSNFAIKNNDPSAQNLDPNFLTHTYNINFPLKFPIKNLRRLTLKSVEIPLILSNVRNNNGTILFPILFNIGAFTNIFKAILIPVGSYTTTSALLTAINSAITAQLNTPTNYGATITLSAIVEPNGRSGLTICSVAHNCSSLQIQQSGLTQHILGFNTYNASSTTPINGTSPINVNIDNYIYMQITNIPIMNNNILPYTFKIPLNNIVNNTVYYYDTAENQSIFFNESTFVLTSLNIILVDKIYCNLIGYQNWGMTFLIEYDDDINQIEFLNLNN